MVIIYNTKQVTAVIVNGQQLSINRRLDVWVNLDKKDVESNVGTIRLTREEQWNPLRSLSSHPKLQFCEVSPLVLEKLRGADTAKSARVQVVSGSWWFRLCVCWAMFPCGGLLPQDSQGLRVQTHLDCSAGASGLQIRDTVTWVVDCSA